MAMTRLKIYRIKHQRQTNTAAPGFTLIELLVVIAVIAVLNSALSVYYYLRVLVALYMRKPVREILSNQEMNGFRTSFDLLLAEGVQAERLEIIVRGEQLLTDVQGEELPFDLKRTVQFELKRK